MTVERLPARCLHRKAMRSSYPSGPFHSPKGESYKRSPIVKYQINEHGTVSEVKLRQSSGIQDIDRKMVGVISRWKLEPVAGCGIVETEISVTVDWQ